MPWKPSQPATTSQTRRTGSPPSRYSTTALRREEIRHPDIFDLEQDGRAGREAGGDEVLHDLLLAVDGDALAGELGEVDAVPVAVDGDLDPMMDEGLAIEPLGQAEPAQELDRRLLQHPGAHTAAPRRPGCDPRARPTRCRAPRAGGTAPVRPARRPRSPPASAAHGSRTPRYARGAMAAVTGPPFRADHVGSLLRPERLLRAREEHAAGRLSADERRAVEDDAIRGAVAMQEDIGLQSATDGEFRRASWHMDFIYQLGGVGQADERMTVRFRNADGVIEFTPAALRVHGRVALAEPIFADAFTFLRRHGDDGGAEAHHPVAEHGALPRRAGRHRRERLPRPRPVLGRPQRARTPPRCGRWPRSAARTSSSTTPASPT